MNYHLRQPILSDQEFNELLSMIDNYKGESSQPKETFDQPEPEFTADEVEMIQAPWSYLTPPQSEPPTIKEQALGKVNALLNNPNRVFLADVYEALVIASYALAQSEPVVSEVGLPSS
jgi:hypothetical protein